MSPQAISSLPPRYIYNMTNHSLVVILQSHKWMIDPLMLQGNMIDPSITSAQVRPIDYRRAANIACNTHIEDVRTVFPNVREDNVPFLCMDLLYEYTLLVNGFGKWVLLVTNINVLLCNWYNSKN